LRHPPCADAAPAFLRAARPGPCIFTRVTLDESTPPPAIPDYELLRLVGRGSYGDVWLARGVTGLFRAIKIVWRARFADAQPFEREFRGLKEFAAISLLEARQLALLHVGRNETDGFFYYVMELADDAATGREIDPARYVPLTLREVRARRGRLPAPEVIALGAELARALAGLHTRGLVHRDIKPSNVILVGGAPKLADIGLVAAASAAHTFVGTEGYVPPEGPGAPSADVFSLGKLLYELATGLDRHDYPRLPADFATLPDRKELLELNEVLIRACEPNATKRHTDATALLEDLQLLIAGKSVRRLRNAERRLSRALRVAAVLALVAGVAGAGAWIEQQRANKELALRQKAEAERDALALRKIYSGNLASAQRALGHDDRARAKKLLLEVVPHQGSIDIRGFEWHALWDRAQGGEREVIRESGPSIDVMAISPDESRLAAHDGSGAVVVYETATRRQKLRLANVRRFVGFSSDGNWLVGAESGPVLRRWSATDGRVDSQAQPIRLQPLFTFGTDLVAGVPDEKRFDSLHIWSFGQNKLVRQINCATGASEGSWSVFRTGTGMDGTTFVIAAVQGDGSSARFRLICVSNDPETKITPLELGRARPSAVGVDSIGAWAVVDNTGEVWRCGADAWRKTAEVLPAGTRKYLELATGNASTYLAAHVREIRWFGPSASGSRTLALGGHRAPISELVLVRRHGILLSADEDGGLFCWQVNQQPVEPDQVRVWDANAGTTRVVFDPDSNGLWVPRDGRSCVRLDTHSLRPTAEIDGMLYPVAMTDRGLIGVATDRGLLRVDAATGHLAERVFVAESPVRLAASDRAGRQFAAVDHAGDLHAFGATPPRRIRQGMNRYFLLLLDERGRTLFTTSSGKDLLCLAWPEGTVRWRAELPTVAPSCLLLPGGRELVVALTNGSLEIRDTATGQLQRQLDSGSAAPQTLAVTPDSRRLFAGGIEGDIHCFDTSAWEEIHALPLGPNVRLHRLVCSPDGKTLAGLTKTGELHVVRTK
jgi:WD40 repeat protein